MNSLYNPNLSSVLLQVEINLEEQQNYHFAVSGRAFSVILEHFPDLLQKVNSNTTYTEVMLVFKCKTLQTMQKHFSN